MPNYNVCMLNIDGEKHWQYVENAHDPHHAMITAEEECDRPGFISMFTNLSDNNRSLDS